MFYGAATSEFKAIKGREVFMVGEGSVAIRLIHDYLRGDVPEVG